MFDGNASRWSWLGGSNTSVNVAGVYTGAANAVRPGSRSNGALVFDPTSLSLWLFGGMGFDSASSGTGNSLVLVYNII